jgi:hypothetical protein
MSMESSERAEPLKSQRAVERCGVKLRELIGGGGVTGGRTVEMRRGSTSIRL